MSASEQVRAFGNAAPTDPLAPRRMLANVRSQLFGATQHVVHVGPYEIVRRLGAGAMGTVFEAFDPRLRRRIAVKVVPIGVLEGRRRSAMLREAQALARLDHPNVVAIYDAGTDGGMVWVAMELLHGQDLQAWLASDDDRDIETTLSVLHEVGAGLVAVHDAGLVHRDVKPSNAFRSDDGRVCLVDFGLAIEADLSDSGSVLDSADSSTGSSSNLTTVVGAAGTPAYMAPEQHRGEGATAASDQYAFCVVAWEAIYGVRPFHAVTVDGLYLRKLEARLPEMSPRAGIGHDLHRVLLRGLAADPHDRWSSMRELLAEMPSTRRPRRRAGAAVLGLGAVAFVVGWAAAAPTRGRACTDEGAPAVWTARDHDEVQAAVLGDGSAVRRETWDRIAPRLDAHARSLAAAHAEICRSVDADGIDEPLADRRFACLRHERSELAGLVDTLRGGELQVVTNAAEWVGSLEDPTRCAVLEPADDVRPMPPAAIAADVESLRDRLWRAETELRRGALDDALATATAVLPEAEELGFAALVAEAEYKLGRVHRARREWDAAESFLTAAYFEGRAARDAEVEFDAAVEMIQLVGLDMWRSADGWDWLERARAADDGESLQAAVALLALESMLRTAGDDDRGAADVMREAHARAAGLGAAHPVSLAVANGLIVALNLVNRFEESLALARENVALRTRLLGAEHPSLAPLQHNLGIAAWELGETDEARAAFERSILLDRRYRGERSYDVGIDLLQLGRRSAFAGDLERAQVILDEGCSILTESLGADHPATLSCTLSLGDLALAEGRMDDASVIYDRVRVLAETSLGTDSTLVGLALSGQGRIQLAGGRIPEARATLERAWVVLAAEEPEGERSIEFGELCLALADATWRAGGPRDRAMELARSAPAPDPRNPTMADHARRVEAWVRAHEGLDPT